MPKARAFQEKNQAYSNKYKKNNAKKKKKRNAIGEKPPCTLFAFCSESKVIPYTF